MIRMEIGYGSARRLPQTPDVPSGWTSGRIINVLAVFLTLGGCATPGAEMIRELKSGGYRLYSVKQDPKTGRRRNLGTFKSRTAAERHERAVQFFKRR